MERGGRRHFPPVFRLRFRWEYKVLWIKGKKFHTDHFIVVFLAKPSGPTRLGVTASRKIGGAVVRNRVKRLVREFFRNNISRLPKNTDFSIVAKKGAQELDYARVCQELSFLAGEIPGSGISCSEKPSLP